MEYHIFVSGNLKGYISQQDSRAISEYMKQNFPAVSKNFNIICHEMELGIVTLYKEII